MQVVLRGSPPSPPKAFCPAGVADLETVSQTLSASIRGRAPFRCPGVVDPAAMHQPEVLEAIIVAVSLASYILICVDGTWQQAMEMFKVMFRKLFTSYACQWAELTHAKLCECGVTALFQLPNLPLLQAAQAKVLQEFDFIQRVQLQCSRWSTCQQDLLAAHIDTIADCLPLAAQKPSNQTIRMSYSAASCGSLHHSVLQPWKPWPGRSLTLFARCNALLCQCFWPAGRSVSWRAMRKCTACC